MRFIKQKNGIAANYRKMTFDIQKNAQFIHYFCLQMTLPNIHTYVQTVVVETLLHNFPNICLKLFFYTSLKLYFHFLENNFFPWLKNATPFSQNKSWSNNNSFNILLSNKKKTLFCEKRKKSVSHVHVI